MGNYKSSTLETLAKRGDGNHFYIQFLEDLDDVLSNTGNLINIASDVKLNVEFNPRLVSNYRLIGYENRLLKPEDFTEIGRASCRERREIWVGDEALQTKDARQSRSLLQDGYST